MEEWLTVEDGQRLKHIRNHVTNIWKNKPTIKYYTPHDDTHCNAVEKKLYKLIPGKTYELLSDKERFLLLASAWLHDVGMIPDLFGIKESDDIIRDKHHERSAEFIQQYKDQLGLNQQEPEILKEICFYHRKSENIETCTENREIAGKNIRVKLLSAYLRLADALHIDQTRTDEYLYKVYLMTNIPKEEKFHWIKSRSIDTVSPNAESMTIRVTMFIPQDWGDWGENKVKPLMDLITEEIQEELDTVKNILIRGKVSMFLEVVPDVQKSAVMSTQSENVTFLQNDYVTPQNSV